MISRVLIPNDRGTVIGPAIANNPENDGQRPAWQEAAGHKVMRDTWPVSTHSWPKAGTCSLRGLDRRHHTGWRFGRVLTGPSGFHFPAGRCLPRRQRGTLNAGPAATCHDTRMDPATRRLPSR